MRGQVRFFLVQWLDEDPPITRRQRMSRARIAAEIEQPIREQPLRAVLRHDEGLSSSGVCGWTRFSTTLRAGRVCATWDSRAAAIYTENGSRFVTMLDEVNAPRPPTTRPQRVMKKRNSRTPESTAAITERLSELRPIVNPARPNTIPSTQSGESAISPSSEISSKTNRLKTRGLQHPVNQAHQIEAAGAGCAAAQPRAGGWRRCRRPAAA